MLTPPEPRYRANCGNGEHVFETFSLSCQCGIQRKDVNKAGEGQVMNIETPNCKVSFQSDAATKEAVFQRVLAFFVEHEAFSGESIMQNDNPQILAPVAFSEIAELFHFEVEWKD